MTPLTLFLLGCATVFLGSIQAAFSALMRLSLRLMAERGGRDDRLGQYLDDPLQLFVPVRILIGVCTVLAGVLIARLSDVQRRAVDRHVHRLAGRVRGRVRAPASAAHRPARSGARARRHAARLPHGRRAARARHGAHHQHDSRLAGSARRPNGANGSDVAAPAATGEGEPEERAISEEEGRELLQTIVDFTGTIVREVMTPRPDIIAIRADATLQDLRSLFREEQYSRMPVYRDNLDNVVGIVFVKDLVALPPGAEPPMTTLMRSAHFVPESKRVSELLKEMQRRQAQMAIVVDEYGGTAGLVTVEDLLEEIVGEIRDEYDVESETVTDEGNGTFAFSGKVSVDEVRDRLDVDIEREGFETVGGYLLSHLGRMPYVGETLEVDGLSFEVLEVERRRITKVRARRREVTSDLGQPSTRT